MMVQMPPAATHSIRMTHEQHLAHKSHYYSIVSAAVIHSTQRIIAKGEDHIHGCPSAVHGNSPLMTFFTEVDSDKYLVLVAEVQLCPPMPHTLLLAAVISHQEKLLPPIHTCILSSKELSGGCLV